MKHANPLIKMIKDITFITVLVLVATSLLLLSACSGDTPNMGADGYRFGDKQYSNEDVSVSVVTYTEEDFRKEVSSRNLPEEVQAFSILYENDTSRCVIHMVDPAENYQPEFVGHEFLHCVYGQWHTSNEEYS